MVSGPMDALLKSEGWMEYLPVARQGLCHSQKSPRPSHPAETYRCVPSKSVPLTKNASARRPTRKGRASKGPDGVYLLHIDLNENVGDVTLNH